MRRVAVRIGSLAIGVVLAATLSGPAAAQTSSPEPDVVLDIGIVGDVTSLNPYNLCCSWDYSYLVLPYDLAIGYGRDLTPAPSVVSSWEPSADHMTWTLTVRDDAMWHDGRPVTAEDVAFSFSLIADNGMPFYKDYLPFSPTFEVVDETRVLWSSEQPTFAPEVPAYIPLVPEHVWGPLVVDGDPKETRTAVKEYENDPPIGSGPFRLTEYSKGQFMRFEAFDDYWGGTPSSLDEVVIRIFENDEAMGQALRTGEIDFATGLSATLFDTVTKDPTITGHVADGAWWNDLAFNFGGQGKSATNHPAIKDVTVRQAAALAIDKQAIVDRVYRGLAEVGDSILPPGRTGYWYHPIPDEIRFDHDPQRAIEMLEGAGYLDTDGDGVREMPGGGEPLQWKIMTISDVDGSVETGQLIKGFLEDVGIGVEVFTVNTNKAYDVWGAGDFDAYVWGWGSDPDPDFILSVFTSGQCLGWSDGCYSNSEYDAMYAEQKTIFDREERKALIVDMQELLAEEVPTIVLSYQVSLEAFRNDRFTGFEKTPDNEAGTLLLSAYDTRSFMSIEPVSAEAAAAPRSKGLPGWLWAAAAAGAIAIAIGVAMVRRRGADDEL